MFWFRRPRPPLPTSQRVDIELLLRRTIETIGSERARSCHIVTDLQQLALDQSSPQRLLESASRELLDRLPMMREPVEILVRDAEDLGHQALYQAAIGGDPARILIARQLLGDPLRTLMELAYQYSSHYWNLVRVPLPTDAEPRTTNLLPLCCGLGILASDSSLYDQQWSQAGYSGWSISRSGYYTAAEIGYAMALLARFRSEEEPSWRDRLRLDSRVTTTRAAQYFAEQQRLGRSLLFDAERIPSTTSDTRQLAIWLAGDDPSFALAAAYALGQQDELSEQISESVIVASRSGDMEMVPLAAKLLGRARRVTPVIQQRIGELISESHPPTAIAAILSAQSLGIPLTGYRTRIAKLLDQFAQDSFPLLEVVRQQGREFASFETQICQHLGRAIQSSDEELASALIACLRCIAAEPRRAIEVRIRSLKTRHNALQRFDAAV